MNGDPVLAVDVGTSSVRAAVVGRDAVVLDSSRVTRHGDTGSHFDARAMWDDVRRAIGALDARSRRSVGAVGVAAHLGWVLVDAELRPVVGAGGWASNDGVDAVAALLGPSELRRTGRPVPAAGPVAALVGHRHRAGATASPRFALAPVTFLTAALTGVPAVDRTSAAYAGVLDVRSGEWCVDVLDALGVDPSRLGRLVAATDVVGSVRDVLADELGLRRGVPVVAGGPDGTVGMTHLLGADAECIGDVAGTTDVIAMRTSEVPDDPNGAVINPFPLGGWTIGGPTGMTGGAVDHWCRLLGFADVRSALDALGTSVLAIPTGSGGLTVGTALSGGRFPTWDRTETGTVDGMRPDHGPAHLVRAAIEGAARTVRAGIDALGVDDAVPVVLAGGAARNPTVARIRADVLGRPVRVCDTADATVLGAAMLAAAGTRGLDLAAFRPSCVELEPTGRAPRTLVRR
jgi:xylulokinase